MNASKSNIFLINTSFYDTIDNNNESIISIFIKYCKPIRGSVEVVPNRILPPEEMSELEKANLDQQISQKIMNVHLSVIQKQLDVVSAEAQG
jgi:hypothetical protein